MFDTCFVFEKSGRKINISNNEKIATVPNISCLLKKVKSRKKNIADVNNKNKKCDFIRGAIR